MFLMRCDCGNTIEVALNNLRTGNTNSCGCYQRKRTSEASLLHGLREHPLYGIWCDIYKRCNNKNSKRFKDYGGRGIQVAPEWREFLRFYEDMNPTYKPGLFLERVDNNGNYEKQNCVWATLHQQARNKRNNYWVKLDGVRMCCTDAAKVLGVTKGTVKRWVEEESPTNVFQKHTLEKTI